MSTAMTPTRSDEPTLAELFARPGNSLNAIRLVLASAVIVRHADVVIHGTMDASLAIDQVFGQLPVDGFFALSGFLISASWVADPRPRSFLLARCARLLPAFWVCLALTVLIAGPLAGLVRTGRLDPGYGVVDGVRYLVSNAALVMFDNSIGGTPTGVPWPGDWNASLWTLKWEFLCYLGVLVLGLTGLLLKRRLMVGTLVAAWVIQTLALIAYVFVPGILLDAARFFLMYMSGVALFVVADKVRVRPRTVALAIVAILLCATFVPGYRILVGPFVAFALVGLGVLVRRPRLRHDLSYGMYIYGFPIEQILAGSPVREWGLVAFSAVAIVATVPLAAVSWFGIERPVHRWARGRRDRGRAPASPPQVVGG